MQDQVWLLASRLSGWPREVRRGLSCGLWQGGLLGLVLVGADAVQEVVQVAAVNFQLNGRAVWL